MAGKSFENLVGLLRFENIPRRLSFLGDEFGKTSQEETASNPSAATLSGPITAHVASATYVVTNSMRHLDDLRSSKFFTKTPFFDLKEKTI